MAAEAAAHGFTADVAANAGGAVRIYSELRNCLKEMSIAVTEDDKRDMWTRYAPDKSYEPTRIKLLFPDSLGILAIEGLVLSLEKKKPTDELRLALNYLNAKGAGYRFFTVLSGDCHEVIARRDVLPNLERAPSIHVKELAQALTGVCVRRRVLGEPLRQVQGGRPWRGVKDALAALR